MSKAKKEAPERNTLNHVMYLETKLDIYEVRQDPTTKKYYMYFTQKEIGTPQVVEYDLLDDVMGGFEKAYHNPKPIWN
jgi:hypothetical protein